MIGYIENFRRKLKGTHEQNECRKNLKIKFTLSVKRTKFDWMSSEEIGGN
jgi:hypothetical protein